MPVHLPAPITRRIAHVAARMLDHYVDVSYSDSPEFYVYVLLDPRKPGPFEYEVIGTGKRVRFSYQPFYIGKGKGRRELDHVIEARNGGRNRKCTTIRKLLRLGLEPIVIRVSDNHREIDALACEHLLIKSVRRLCDGGPLTNVSLGGQSSAGYKHTEGFKSYISKLHSGRALTEGHKVSEAKKGVPLTEKHKKALSEAKSGKPLSESQISALKRSWSQKTAAERSVGAVKAARTMAGWSEARKAEHRKTLSGVRKATWAGYSDEERAAIIAGKPPHSAARREQARAHFMKLNERPPVTCPHCDTSGQFGAMARWHFDNCKYR